MRKLLFTAVALGALAIPSSAWGQTVVGPVLAYHDQGWINSLGVGGFVSIPLTQTNVNLSIRPEVVVYFPDQADYWEANVDLIYRFPVSSSAAIAPFVLGGLNFANGGGSTDLGINLGGGIQFPSASVRPVVGAKVELEGGDDLVLFGAIGFPIG